MHDDNRSNKPILPQARATERLLEDFERLSPRIKQVFADLILLYHHPPSPETDNLITHFWKTLPDRLTDEEYIRFLKLTDLSGRGGAS